MHFLTQSCSHQLAADAGMFASIIVMVMTRRTIFIWFSKKMEQNGAKRKLPELSAC
jgi:hypothetical protein